MRLVSWETGLWCSPKQVVMAAGCSKSTVQGTTWARHLLPAGSQPNTPVRQRWIIFFSCAYIVVNLL